MNGYFEGWYFKQRSKQNFLALIPALHEDYNGKRSASLQIITDEASYCANFPYEALNANRQKLFITAGNSTFSANGIDLDIKSETINAKGQLNFGKLSTLKYDIMGPFRFIPFMECRHSVFSMTHRVCGSLTINGKDFDFNDSVGYIEGDRGRSFPKQYSWTQCNWFDNCECSLMLSAADIPLVGKIFTGIIGIVLWQGKEYRIATYCGSKVISIKNGKIEVCQGKYTLCAELLETNARYLCAPKSGEMSRLIRESPSCRARYRFIKGNNVLFDFTSDCASFEYEYEK